MHAKSNVPPRHRSVKCASTGTSGAVARTGFDSDLKPHGVLHCSPEEDLLGDILDKAVDPVEMRKEKERHNHLADTMDNVRAKYMEKYSPQRKSDIIYSAQVAIPRINFSKVKPHMHRKLPQPVPIAVQGCFLDPASSKHQERCRLCSWRLGDSNSSSSDYKQ